MSSNEVKSCVKCHFFVTLLEQRPFEIRETERLLASQNNFEWVRSVNGLRCNMTVWDEGAGGCEPDRYKRIVTTDRANSCFFFPYQPGMLLPAAEVLQKRKAEADDAAVDRELTRHDLELTRKSLNVAVIALVVSVAFSVIGTIVSIVGLFKK